MRRTFLIALLLAVGWFEQPAFGQRMESSTALCTSPFPGADNYGCPAGTVIRNPGGGADSPSARHSSSGASTSSIRYQPYWRLVSGGGPNGEVCRAVSYYPMAPADDPRQPYFYGFELDPATASYPECPNQPRDPSQPESPVSWDDVIRASMAEHSVPRATMWGRRS
jgi:hypothetical protein